MDTTTLAMIAAGLGGVLLGWNILGWLSALRRRWQRAPVVFYHSHRTGWGLKYDPRCPSCNPQPTSQPPSAPMTGRGAGPSQLSDASLDSANWPQAARENED